MSELLPRLLGHSPLPLMPVCVASSLMMICIIYQTFYPPTISLFSRILNSYPNSMDEALEFETHWMEKIKRKLNFVDGEPLMPSSTGSDKRTGHDAELEMMEGIVGLAQESLKMTGDSDLQAWRLRRRLAKACVDIGQGFWMT